MDFQHNTLRSFVSKWVLKFDCTSANWYPDTPKSFEIANAWWLQASYQVLLSWYTVTLKHSGMHPAQNFKESHLLIWILCEIGGRTGVPQECDTDRGCYVSSYLNNGNESQSH